MTSGCRRIAARSLLPHLIAAAVLLTACASTTYEPGTTATPATSTAGSAEPTTPVKGAAEDLLPQLATEAAGLSTLMREGGDDDAAADRIAALWAATQQQIAASRPDLLADFAANVTRCADAVRFHRAADADKAAANLAALVKAYLG